MTELFVRSFPDLDSSVYDRIWQLLYSLFRVAIEFCHCFNVCTVSLQSFDITPLKSFLFIIIIKWDEAVCVPSQAAENCRSVEQQRENNLGTVYRVWRLGHRNCIRHDETERRALGGQKSWDQCRTASTRSPMLLECCLREDVSPTVLHLEQLAVQHSATQKISSLITLLSPSPQPSVPNVVL